MVLGEEGYLYITWSMKGRQMVREVMGQNLGCFLELLQVTEIHILYKLVIDDNLCG